MSKNPSQEQIDEFLKAVDSAPLEEISALHESLGITPKILDDNFALHRLSLNLNLRPRETVEDKEKIADIYHFLIRVGGANPNIERAEKPGEESLKFSSHPHFKTLGIVRILNQKLVATSKPADEVIDEIDELLAGAINPQERETKKFLEDLENELTATDAREQSDQNNFLEDLAVFQDSSPLKKSNGAISPRSANSVNVTGANNNISNGRNS